MQILSRVALVSILGWSLLGGVNFALAEETTTTTISSAATSTVVAVAKSVASAADVEALNKEIQKRKDTIQRLEQTISTYQKSIDQKQTEGMSLKNQLSILDLQSKNLQADLDLTTEKINQAQLEIEALSISISEKEATIARQKSIIAKLIQSINADSRRQYFEVLLSYNNFAQFYSNLTSLEYVYSDLGRTVRSYRLAKEDLATKVNQVTQRKSDLKNLQTDQQNKQDVLVAQASVKATLLTQTKSKELEYRALVASLKQQYQQTETEQRNFENKLRQTLEDENKLVSGSDVSFSWPVPSHFINAMFHDRDYPFRNVFEHTGIDIKASFGTPVHAAAAGYVARAKRCTVSTCYAYVLMVHTSNLSTVYGHLSQILVTEDQFVNRGDVIGFSGGTPGTVGAGPFVTGPHLHFEARLNGIPVNPLTYLIQ